MVHYILIEIEKTRNGVIEYVGTEKLHGYNVICPYCYKEMCSGYRIDIRDWIHNALIGCKEDDVITAPCGCSMSVFDFYTRLIPIDELISKPVSRLNMSGYLTKYSCSGHLHAENGYVAFSYKYDDLVSYLIHDSYLNNILDIEVNMVDIKNKIMNTFKWDNGRKSWTLIEEYPMEDTYGECVVVRMKHNLNKMHKSRLDKMLMFRRALMRIANWCEKAGKGIHGVWIH